MYLKLQRQPPNGETLRGHLYIDGKLYCDTLERTSKAILPLIYAVQVTQSPKFKRLLPLVMNVPGRTGIRIHRGSRPAHSQGCILVSPDVEQSITQLLLQAQREREEIRLEIYEQDQTQRSHQHPADDPGLYPGHRRDVQEER